MATRELQMTAEAPRLFLWTALPLTTPFRSRWSSRRNLFPHPCPQQPPLPLLSANMGASSKLGTTVDILQEKIGSLQKSRMKVSAPGRKGFRDGA